jgi:hypothetical protein
MSRVVLALLLLVAHAVPAAAQQPAGTPDGRWGAIAFGAPDLSAGWAVDYWNADEARQAALRQCSGCTRTITFVRACAAVAESPGGAVGFSRTRWRGRVIARAIELCSHDAPDCKIVAVACTTH